MDITALKLQKVLSTRFKLYRKNPTIAFKDIDQLTGLMTFSLMMLYFYDKIAVSALKKSIVGLFNELNLSTNDFDIIYTASIKLMFKRGLIEKQNVQGEYYYCLADQGLLKAMTILNRIAIPERSRVINKVRLDIIRNQFC